MERIQQRTVPVHQHPEVGNEFFIFQISILFSRHDIDSVFECYMYREQQKEREKLIDVHYRCLCVFFFSFSFFHFFLEKKKQLIDCFFFCLFTKTTQKCQRYIRKKERKKKKDFSFVFSLISII